jgi:replicative DNA helicase
VIRRQGGGVDPPHNLEAEESLIGAMMLSREAVTAAVEAHIEGRDFYKPAHGVIYDAAFMLHSRGEPVDPVTVSEELRRSGQLDAIGGRPALLRIQAATPASANAAQYANIVSELSMLRKLIETAADIQHMAFDVDDDVDETLDRAESMIFEVAEKRVSDSLVPLYPVLEQTLVQLEHSVRPRFHAHRRADRFHDPTISCSACSLRDEQPSAALDVREHSLRRAALHCALDAKKPVLFFSMEMGHLELTKRLLAAEAQIDARKLSTGRLSEHEWPKLNQAVGRLAEAPFFIDDNPHCTVMEMRAKARRTRGVR